MKTILPLSIRKNPKPENWEPGPWMNEPDQILTKYNDRLIIVNRARMGNLNGYVQVVNPQDANHYDDFPVHVHGGLTFMGSWGVLGLGLFVGFDCAHGNDLVPSMSKIAPYPDCVYKDIWFVLDQCFWLCDQLVEKGF